jgi:hypothetical protein
MDVTDLYRKALEDKKINADKAWETIKFSVTILSTLATVTIALLGAFSSLIINPYTKVVIIGTTVVIPLLMSKWRGMWDLNPRGLSTTDLAGLPHTRLGESRTR